MAKMTVSIRLAWWFPLVLAVLAPLARVGVRLPRRATAWIASKAAKVVPV